MYEAAELQDTKAEAEFESEVERIAVMSIVEVHAGLRKFGLEPTKNLPQELRQLLNSSRRSRKRRLDSVASLGSYIVSQLTQPAWKLNAVQFVSVVLVFASAFAFWKPTSRGPVGDPTGRGRSTIIAAGNRSSPTSSNTGQRKFDFGNEHRAGNRPAFNVNVGNHLSEFFKVREAGNPINSWSSVDSHRPNALTPGLPPSFLNPPNYMADTPFINRFYLESTEPAVGTRGPEVGPSGLFTIYEGQMLLRGEYTLSIAHSNFDHDPGNIDIVDTSASLNIGSFDLELFFMTTAFRGIDVNSRPGEDINNSRDRLNNEARDIAKQIAMPNPLDRGSNAETDPADEATARLLLGAAVLYEDLNGFHRQFWIGHRQSTEPFIHPDQPPAAVLNASRTTIRLPCTVQGSNSTDCPVAGNMHVALTTDASDPDGDTLFYSYAPSGGRIVGEGATVTWDLSGVGPGTYKAVVRVDDRGGLVTEALAEVKVTRCTHTKASSASSGTPLSKGEERARTYSRRESRAGDLQERPFNISTRQRKQEFHQPVM